MTSVKVYTLKKDLKTIIVKSNEKFLQTLKGHSPASKKIRVNWPTINIRRRSGAVTKSLQSIRLTKSSNNTKTKSPTDPFSVPTIQRKCLNSNLRYLKENFDDTDQQNTLKTPSESVKSVSRNVKELVNQEYEKYIEGAWCQGVGLRSSTPIISGLGRRKVKNWLCDSPLDLNVFWKDKKNYLRV